MLTPCKSSVCKQVEREEMLLHVDVGILYASSPFRTGAFLTPTNIFLSVAAVAAMAGVSVSLSWVCSRAFMQNYESKSALKFLVDRSAELTIFFV